MAEIRALKRISQGNIHITSVKGGDVRAAKIDFAHVDFPFTPIMGVIREDAELLHSWSANDLLVADLEKTLSAYSTKAKTFVTGANLAPTITLDLDNYSYYVVMRGLGIPQYNTETKQAGRCDYCASTYLYEIVEVPAGEIVTVDGSKALGRNTVVLSNGSAGREVYWTSATAMTVASNITYGTHVLSQAPVVSGTTMTVKAPNYGITGNTKQMTSGAWAHITDIRYEYVVEAYRVKKGKSVDGWGLTSSLRHVLACVREDQPLT